MRTCIEYVWVDKNLNYRSKCKVMDNEINELSDVPMWNFDGSSTNQNRKKENTEVILKPIEIFNDPFRGNQHKMVLCECFHDKDMPTKCNFRNHALESFNKKTELQPWFGLEQEYFIYDNVTKLPLGLETTISQGEHYCGIGSSNIHPTTRMIMEAHLQYCLYAGVKISGINLEVAPGQGEFQVGPCEGIQAGDHLHIARYILKRVGEYYDMVIEFHPKPLKGLEWNGSGCHVNFSTNKMREGTKKHNGFHFIKKAINRLEKTHKIHMKCYGENNEMRMSGECETACYDKFSWSVGGRDVSVRVGNETYENKCGYFEDRRPASNCEPYVVTSLIFNSCCL